MDNVVPVCIPRENVNDDSVKILKWLVADGDAVQEGRPLVEVETSKTTFEVPSPRAGVVKTTVAAGREVAVGGILCYVGETLTAIETLLVSQASGQSGQPSSTSTPAQAKDGAAIDRESSNLAEFATTAPPAKSTRFSRKALAMIRERGLNERDFTERGLIRERDVLAQLGEAVPAAPPSQLGEAESVAPPRGTANVPVRVEAIPRAKRLEADLLSWTYRKAIRSAVTAVVPTSGLAKLKQSNAAAELLSAAVIYECARLLRRYPHLNAYGADGKIHFYEEVNIGYALDAGQGLKVPVLRNADTKTMNSLVDERRQFVADYLNDAFRPESLAAATFTITDLSGDGVFTFDPLIVEGQSAILGIGGDFLLPGMTATAYNLILAFDHRLIEGRMAARFLNDLKDRLQAHEQAIAGSPQIANLQSEPYCSRCLSTLSAIQRLEGYLVHTVGGSKDETKLVCSHCLANV